MTRISSLICAADGDVIDLHRLIGTIVGVAAHPCDLLHQGDAGCVALTEDSVAAVQTRVGDLGDKKLRAVGSGTSIRVGEASGTIELEVIGSFILESVAGIAGSGAHRVTTLNHEVWNYAMEDSAVIKWNAVFFLMSDGAGPILGAGGQADEIGYADRSFVGKKRAGEFACGRVDHRRRLGGSRCWLGLRPQCERGQEND